jgi:hypothetical protein
MPNVSTSPVIFISYSHKDEPQSPAPGQIAWLSYVQSFLAPAVKQRIFELWDDEDIPGGDKWRAAIKVKLDTCDICVLLVSRHSIASDYVLNVEIERMRERQKAEDVHIYPIVLTPFPDAVPPWFMEFQLRPPNGTPLSRFPEAERDEQMVAIANEIAARAREIAGKKQAKQGGIEALLESVIDKGVDFRDAVSLKAIARDAAVTQRADTLGITVDIGHLPETAYERLVGREQELGRLDEVWADRNTNILSLVAWGGAGKTALVHEWLERLQQENYRGAEMVLGWSFYSQGSKGRATSADGFLNWALAKLGVSVDSTSASAKGEKIAEQLAARRILLMLDGVEPLQHGPGPRVGELKDLGLRALLRRFAAVPPGEPHGLMVLSSRLAVKDISRWKDTSAPVIDLQRLSDEAGADLLRDNGVWGTDKELRQAAHDFEGHALALNLLASFLKQSHFGDVRRRDRVRAFRAGEDAAGHDHARRVMESYEREWLKDQPVLRAIIDILSLFDRPASGDCLNALRKEPAIKGLTDVIVGLDDEAWNAAVSQLREVRLIDPIDPKAPDALDAHPLVREWFEERLQQTNEQAWRAAHGRLYEHLRNTTNEGETPKLDDLAPLYQAIAHGCRAGRYQDTLDEIYKYRICRPGPGGRPLFIRPTISARLAAILRRSLGFSRCPMRRQLRVWAPRTDLGY